jgi:hypothetical protein
MAFLYLVTDAANCEPFAQWAQRSGNFDAARLLDNKKRLPEHWFVSSVAVPVCQVRDVAAEIHDFRKLKTDALLKEDDAVNPHPELTGG